MRVLAVSNWYIVMSIALKYKLFLLLPLNKIKIACNCV